VARKELLGRKPLETNISRPVTTVT
jgi:hypothetical protein